MGNNQVDSIGIEFLDNDIPKQTNSALKFSNVGIYFFYDGIKIYNMDAYLMSFNELHIEHGIHSCISILGLNGVRTRNSGENVMFLHCVFAATPYGFYFEHMFGEI